MSAPESAPYPILHRAPAFWPHILDGEHRLSNPPTQRGQERPPRWRGCGIVAAYSRLRAAGGSLTKRHLLWLRAHTTDPVWTTDRRRQIKKWRTWSARSTDTPWPYLRWIEVRTRVSARASCYGSGQ